MVKVELSLRTEDMTRADYAISLVILVDEAMDGPDLAKELCQLYSAAYGRDATITFRLENGPLVCIPARVITLFQVVHIYGKV